MARRVSWTNNSSGHLGTYVYRAPTLDPQNLPAPVATVDPVAQGAAAEWVDNEELSPGDYDYAVRDYDAGGEGALSGVVAHTVEPSLDTAQIGDEIGGGIYAGTITYADARQFHLIAARPEDIVQRKWGNSVTVTGATDEDDGLANQEQVLNNFDEGDSDAFYYCRDYTYDGNSDFYLPATNEAKVVDDLASFPGYSDLAINIGSSREFWTSTEVTYRYADVESFDGGPHLEYKDRDHYYVIPVRRVQV